MHTFSDITYIYKLCISKSISDIFPKGIMKACLSPIVMIQRGDVNQFFLYFGKICKQILLEVLSCRRAKKKNILYSLSFRKSMCIYVIRIKII